MCGKIKKNVDNNIFLYLLIYVN